MTGRDAFDWEMGFQARIRDLDAERVLTGQRANGSRADLEELASFVSLVRTTVPATPDPIAERALIARLAETARVASREAAPETTPMRPVRRAWRPRLALAAKVAFALALLPAATAGLALAGVTLPEPAREAMERIGLDLPNQSAVEEPATTDSDADEATKRRGRGKGTESDQSARARDQANASAAGKRGKQSERARDEGPGLRQGPPSQGESRGEGEPALGEPAPIVPPGQGGTPPGRGGPSPSQGGGQSSEPPDGTAPVSPPSGVPLERPKR